MEIQTQAIQRQMQSIQALIQEQIQRIQENMEAQLQARREQMEVQIQAIQKKQMQPIQALMQEKIQRIQENMEARIQTRRQQMKVYIQAIRREAQEQALAQNLDIPSVLHRPISYCCKDFRNTNINNEMDYFNEHELQEEFNCNQDVSYIESKVIYHQNAFITNNQLFTCYQLEPATNDILRNLMDDAFIKMSENWQTVSSCRFVFAKFNNPAVEDDEIQGILFYTDTHYGHNLIDLARTNMLTRRCRKINCRRRRQEINEELPNLPEDLRKGGKFLCAIKILCKACKYRMQHEVIKQMIRGERDIIFPFFKIGRLTLTYQNHELQNIALDPIIPIP